MKILKALQKVLVFMLVIGTLVILNGFVDAIIELYERVGVLESKIDAIETPDVYVSIPEQLLSDLYDLVLENEKPGELYPSFQ